MSAAQLSPMAALRLCLYVAGDSPNSVTAERNLRRLLSSYPALGAELEIRDVLVDPEAGLRAKVIATPMLLKLAPEPERRILGDLHDLDLLRDVLGLRDTGTDTSAK
jgi:circadian clock protein KaiB